MLKKPTRDRQSFTTDPPHGCHEWVTSPQCPPPSTPRERRQRADANCPGAEESSTVLSAFGRTPTPRVPSADLPVHRIRLFTKVDQHVQMSQSVLVLQQNRHKGSQASSRHHTANQLLARNLPRLWVQRESILNQWFLTFSGSWTPTPPSKGPHSPRLGLLAEKPHGPAPPQSPARPPAGRLLVLGASSWEGHTDEGDKWQVNWNGEGDVHPEKTSGEPGTLMRKEKATHCVISEGKTVPAEGKVLIK